MVSGYEIAVLALLGGAIWLWLDSLKVREIAVRAARSACNAESLLLLDDTVAIANIGVERDDEGRLTLKRAYDFEYSDTGNNRLRGSVMLRGKRVILINVGVRPPPDVRTLH